MNELPRVVEIKDGTVTAISGAVREAGDAMKHGAPHGRIALVRHRSPGPDPGVTKP